MRARETATNEREAQLLTEISDLVHGVTMPFACGGTLVPNKPVTLLLPLDFDVRWVVPPPRFNFALQKPHTIAAEQTEDSAPNRTAVQHFRGCEYSATGYFGNESGDTDFYVYAALHVEWPRRAEREGRKKTVKRDARATRRAPERAPGRSPPLTTPT